MLSTTAYLVKQINYFNSSKNFLVIDSNPWHLSKQNRSWTKSKASSLHGLWIRGSLRSKISWLWAHKIIKKRLITKSFMPKMCLIMIVKENYFGIILTCPAHLKWKEKVLIDLHASNNISYNHIWYKIIILYLASWLTGTRCLKSSQYLVDIFIFISNMFSIL